MLYAVSFVQYRSDNINCTDSERSQSSMPLCYTLASGWSMCGRQTRTSSLVVRKRQNLDIDDQIFVLNQCEKLSLSWTSPRAAYMYLLLSSFTYVARPSKANQCEHSRTIEHPLRRTTTASRARTRLRRGDSEAASSNSQERHGRSQCWSLARSTIRATATNHAGILPDQFRQYRRFPFHAQRAAA